MSNVKLSSKGQVVIPKSIRDKHQWRDGQVLEVVDTADGLLLRDKPVFPPAKLNDLAGCLPYRGKAKTLDEMESAIRTGAKEQR
jgi:AbrB family looped-hinge helix DNA binding protein